MSDELLLRLARAREAFLDQMDEARLLRAAAGEQRERLELQRRHLENEHTKLLEERDRIRAALGQIRSLQVRFYL